jgi:hypothetical protein
MPCCGQCSISVAFQFRYSKTAKSDLGGDVETGKKSPIADADIAELPLAQR